MVIFFFSSAKKALPVLQENVYGMDFGRIKKTAGIAGRHGGGSQPKSPSVDQHNGEKQGQKGGKNTDSIDCF